MIKVSVIVPVYNVEKYLSECLDSLVKQTLKEIEILVINDGSTDGSQAIIDQYQATYPSIIKSFIKPNGGIADVRNFGLERVQGEYFAFLDSDDSAEASMLEKMYYSAKQSDADVVFSNFVWSYPDKEILTIDGPYHTNQEILTQMFATLWNKLYKTAWIKKTAVNFPKGYRYEDASFLYKLTPYIRRSSHVNEAFVQYRQVEGSITHNHNERVKDMIFVFEDILTYYKQNDFYEGYHSELEYLFTRFFLGNSFLRSCQIKDARDRAETLKKSFQLLTHHFPNFNKNPYLKTKGKKALYFRTVNAFTYPIYAKVFTFIYQHIKKEVLHS